MHDYTTSYVMVRHLTDEEGLSVRVVYRHSVHLNRPWLFDDRMHAVRGDNYNGAAYTFSSLLISSGSATHGE